MTRDDVLAAMQAGMRAYALHQANVHDSLRRLYFRQLSVPLGKAAAALALDDGDLPSLFDMEGMCPFFWQVNLRIKTNSS
jgi:hypothetical protein